jgi:prepilin-type processing-associated H-X9-DG protein
MAVVALLSALLLPAVLAARSAAQRMSCSVKMRQIGIAIHNYHNVHTQLPPSKWGTETYSEKENDAKPKHNILTFLLPYLELQEIYEKIDFSVHWSDALNDTATKRDLSIFQCPKAPRKNSYKTHVYYIADYSIAERIEQTNDTDLENATGIKPLFDNGIVSPRDTKLLRGILRPDGESLTIEAISDGLSNTMMFFECGTRPFIYVLRGSFNNPKEPSSRPNSPGDWASNRGAFHIQTACGGGEIGMQLMNCTNKEEIYSFHNGGANFLFGDGATRFIQESIHPEQFISLFTAIAGDSAALP